MKLHYMLKEGLIDIRVFPTEWSAQGKKNRVNIRLNGTPFVRIIDTNMGKALLNSRDGEMLIIDQEAIEKYGAPEEIIVNINVPEAIQALQK